MDKREIVLKGGKRIEICQCGYPLDFDAEYETEAGVKFKFQSCKFCNAGYVNGHCSGR